MYIDNKVRILFDILTHTIRILSIADKQVNVWNLILLFNLKLPYMMLPIGLFVWYGYIIIFGLDIQMSWK